MDRRSFIGALGASLLAGRLLERRASAQTAQAKRLVVFYSPNGTRPERFWPIGKGPELSIASESVIGPLQAQQSALTVVGGLRYAGLRSHDYGMSTMLTGMGKDPVTNTVTNGASIDQYIAARIPTQRYASLDLGVQASAFGEQRLTRMCFAPGSRMLPPNDDPRDVYRRVFDRRDVVRRYSSRRSVLDLVRSEIHELNARLGTDERHRLDAHLEALRSVERGFEPGPACAQTPSVFELDPLDNDNFARVGRAQMDLLVAALACDLTRVGSIQWSHAASETVCTWLGHADSLHSLSHAEAQDAAYVEMFVESGRWFAEQFAYLVGRLASLPEPAGTGSLLDNSIVLWMSEIADGVTHQCIDMPVVIAGGAGGRVRPGRYLRYGDEDHNRLLTSICWAFGLTNTSFGNADFAVGGLDGFLA